MKLTPEQFDALADMEADVASGLISEKEALSGVLEDTTQRLKETPYDPLEDIRQEHESWLAELEGLAVEAIASNNWDKFYTHVVNFQNEHDLHGESLIDIGDDEQMHKYKPGQLVQSIINGNIYRVEMPLPGIYKLHLIQFANGAKLNPAVVTDYSPSMNQLLKWADQYRAEIEKQSSARASQIESLLIAGDFDAIREWLDQWQLEDKTPGSLRDRYQEVRSELKKQSQHQRFDPSRC